MKNKDSKSSTGRLSWMLSGVLKSKRAEGYVDTAVKVLIAVVIGALLLFGLYGLIGNVVIPTTTSKVASLFNATGAGGAGAGGGAPNEPVTPPVAPPSESVTPPVAPPSEPASTVRSGIIPTGATYTPNGGTALMGNGTNAFPETPNDGDEYEEGDYIYQYNRYHDSNGWVAEKSQNGWGVHVKDYSKTSYDDILYAIAGRSVNTMAYTFWGCTSLTTAPEIPNSVTNMSGTFGGCTSLTTAPTIPSSVTYMGGTFIVCTSLTTAPAIPSGVTNMYRTFYGCTSLTGTIEVNANPTSYDECFYETCEDITLVGSSTMLDELASAANYSNVTV